MNSRKNANTKAQTRFPAEAGVFFDEVAEEKLEALWKESCEKFPAEDFEVVDGIDYPFPQCA